jgi:uncharacterized protein YcsI (UPF0317 family)
MHHVAISMTARHPLQEQPQAGRQARLACRTGQITGATANLASGLVQGNLAILPEKLAAAFHRFCQLNPKPCPIIGISEAGNPRIASLGIDLDIRTDLPRYRVWRDGKLIEEPTDIVAHWRDDLVAFVIGCSFSFEHALMADGLTIRHIEQGCNVPMYRTNLPCTPAGPFAGPLVVSMRPFRQTRFARSRSPLVFQQCMARRCTLAIPPTSASATSRSRTTAMR